MAPNLNLVIIQWLHYLELLVMYWLKFAGVFLLVLFLLVLFQFPMFKSLAFCDILSKSGSLI